MSKNRGRDFSVQGDGNAFGDNNRLTVIKTEKHHHHHRSSPGGGEPGSGGGEIIFAVGVAMIVACVAGSYFFSLNAPVVYAVLQSLTGTEFIAASYLLYREFEEEDGVNLKLLTLLILSSLASAALFVVHADYRDELTTMAQVATSAKEFWCSMNDYGRKLALLHAVTGVFGFGAGSLFLALPTGAMFAERYFALGSEDWGRTIVSRLTSWVVIVLGAVLLLGAAYMHTDSGWSNWSRMAGSPPAFFCPPRSR